MGAAMDRLRSPEDFEDLLVRLVADTDPSRPTLVISAGTCGQASGANDIIRVAKRQLLERGLGDRIALRITGCNGYCEAEPSIVVEPRRTFYAKVSMGDVGRIVEAVAEGRVLEDLLSRDAATGETIECQDDLPFFRRQVRTIMSRNERIDPIRIYHSLRNGGYSAFLRCLRSGDPGRVVELVKASGLRGRGGAGFPTGAKWELLAAQPSGRGKVLICNADEGDPGAYMDRSVLEGNPHCVLEGMLVAAFATGSNRGIIYVRSEYPLAIKHVLPAPSCAARRRP